MRVSSSEANGSDWYLDPLIRVTNVSWQGYSIDLLVSHGLRPGVLRFEGAPQVERIERIERSDGSPLGSGELRLDLGDLAVEGVIRGAATVLVQRSDGVYIGGSSGDPWRETVRVVRLAAAEFRRVRWTDAMDDHLVAAWKHIREHGCARRADLAAEIGMTERRVADRLRQLRKDRGVVEVPEGPRGRPAKRRD